MTEKDQTASDAIAHGPFLIRVYENMDPDKVSESSEFTSIHVFKSQSLRSVLSLLTPALPALAQRLKSISFKCVQSRPSGKMIAKDIGTLYNYRSVKDETKTLQEAGVQPGDFLSIVIGDGVRSAHPVNRRGRSERLDSRAVNPRDFGLPRSDRRAKPYDRFDGSRLGAKVKDKISVRERRPEDRDSRRSRSRDRGRRDD